MKTPEHVPAIRIVGIEVDGLGIGFDGGLCVVKIPQGAQVTRATDLPEDLKGLASRNALEISDTRFRSDVDRLIEAL